MRSSPHSVLARHPSNERRSSSGIAAAVATCNARTVANPLDASAQSFQGERRSRTIANHITGRAKQGLAEWRHRYVAAWLRVP